MMSSAVKDRNVTQFSQALHRDCTPYTQHDFSFAVKNACKTPGSLATSQYSTKVVVVGDPAVGKTSLILRFCQSIFQRDYKATIGVDFEVEKFHILSIPFSLQLWDTAGAERFKCIAASYYRGANVIIIVFDMSNINTLKSVCQWRDEACSNAQTDEQQQLVFLVGAKTDLLCENALQEVVRQGLAVAAELNAEFWSLSSLTGANVKEFFFRVASLSFDATISRSLLVPLRDKRTIGETQDKRITVRKSTREEEDTWKRMKSKMKCCHS